MFLNRARTATAGVLLLVLASCTSVAPARSAEVNPDPQRPALRLAVSGPSVTVFKKSRDACDPLDIPDAPARAIRTAAGSVQLYAPHFHDRRLAGPDLLHLSNDCRVVFQGDERDDPAAFDDRAWIAALYTPDGQTIFAAVHNEFQGHRRPAVCPSGKYMDCWYNSVTAAVSHDAGTRFSRLTPGADLIAALPYRYDEVTGHHSGYFNPSNIVSKDGALFMMVFATQAKDQQPGNCLLRTDRISDPAAWRGWDGSAFRVAFANPYNAPAQPRDHVCAPVGAGRLLWPVTSLVRHAPTGLFIALMMNGAHDGGIFYSTSPDLITWSKPAKLLSALGEGAYHCGDPAPAAYPSLLDPNSPDRNFMTVGQSADVFLTQYDVSTCQTSMNRDLIRIPVTITAGGN